jgi:hypothetical protein
MASTHMDPSVGATSSFEHASDTRRTAHACRWSYSTLYLSFPDWLDAWDTPWSCRHPAHTGPLETVETCATCPHWTPKEHQ